MIRLRRLGLVLLIWLAGQTARPAEFFVSPDGRPEGDGSRTRPWNLATALGQPDAVRPGDTIRLLGGTYRGGVTSTLRGTSAAPIVVRPAPGERVTLDLTEVQGKTALFNVQGAWAVYRDFEVTCSDPKRVTAIAGSSPEDIQRGSINGQGSHVKFINLIVHDTAQGFGFWSGGEGGELYGCLIYNNGWRGPDRGHGHAIYAQNTSGTKRLADNIMFNQFGYGVHVYGSSRAFLKGFDIEGNVAFNNGALAGAGERAPNLHVGGGSPAERIRVRENFTWSDAAPAANRFGYGAPDVDLLLEKNYFYGPTSVQGWRQVTAVENAIIGNPRIFELRVPKGADAAQYVWTKNRYFQTERNGPAFSFASESGSGAGDFEAWRERTGFDKQSTFSESAPKETAVFVRPNQYEPGRAHVVVYNWEKKDAVEIDPANILKRGQRFRIVSAQDYFGEPIVSGAYEGGTVSIPMGAVKPARPVGMPDYAMPVTGPAFDVFVVQGI